MKALLIGIAFVSLATTAVLADWPSDCNGPIDCDVVLIPLPGYGDCGNSKCDQDALKKDAQVKKQLHLLVPVQRDGAQVNHQKDR